MSLSLLLWMMFRGLFTFFGGAALLYRLRRREWWTALLFLLAFLGCLCNFLVTAANNGYMPVLGWGGDPSALADGVHIQGGAGSRLLWLADVHGTALFRYSIGDVFLFAGIALWMLEVLCKFLDRLLRRMR